MKLCERIDVQDDRLMNGLLPVVTLMSKIESSKDKDCVVDFSHTGFVSPVFLLSLLVYLSKSEKSIQVVNFTETMLAFLLNDVILSDCLRRSEFVALMEHYAKKTYIPIIGFPAKNNCDDKEEILSVVENLIIRQSNIQSNVANGLRYMISETIDNITEHSESDKGYICAQAYPERGYLDICIADKGITLYGSYKKLVDIEIENDLEAIEAANRGISSKNLPNAENRGYGIYTSKKMLVEGLNGQYMIVSGESGYMKSRSVDVFFNLPEGLRWNGTIIAFRIPYNVPKFYYVNYFE